MFSEAQMQTFWRYKSLYLKDLKTTCGQTLVIIEPGLYNAHQGPDFTNARIKVGDVEWAGNIELHLYTSDWVKHAHQLDVNYQNIILHVVWINDIDAYTLSPLLELSKYIGVDQLHQEEDYQSSYHLHCMTCNHTPIEIAKHNQLQQLGIDRIFNRKEQVLEMFHLHKFDYSSVLWRLIFRSFGRSTNADAFETLFFSIPTQVFRLYAFDPQMIEALIMGQSNLLHDQIEDDYPRKLYNFYIELKRRHCLHPIAEKMKFLRMRPRNFPTIRLAQLAAFFHQHLSLVQLLLKIDDFKEINQLFDITPHAYWQTHFLFDRKSIGLNKEIGQAVRQQIIANAFIPFLLAYAEIHKTSSFKDKAFRWLQELRPEQDALILSYSALGFRANSFLETQSLHELHLRYCLHKKCARCERGKMLELV